MKLLTFIIAQIIVFATVAHAEDEDYGYSSENNSVYAGLTFTRGGTGLNVDYEHNLEKKVGVGGFVRMYAKNEDDNEPQSAAAHCSAQAASWFAGSENTSAEIWKDIPPATVR